MSHGEEPLGAKERLLFRRENGNGGERGAVGRQGKVSRGSPGGVGVNRKAGGAGAHTRPRCSDQVGSSTHTRHERKRLRPLESDPHLRACVSSDSQKIQIHWQNNALPFRTTF